MVVRGLSAGGVGVMPEWDGLPWSMRAVIIGGATSGALVGALVGWIIGLRLTAGWAVAKLFGRNPWPWSW